MPSITELLFELGAGARLVGRTRYCEEPVDEVAAVEAVGGTKNPDCRRIIELEPDLVIVNREENRVEDFEALRDAGLRVLVTHPRTVAAAAEMIAEVGEAVGVGAAAGRLADSCREALAAAPTATSGAPRVFCPIWRRPWMTFGPRTYVADVLRRAGLRNVYDDAADSRGDFFEVEPSEVRDRTPQLVLLPDEPYAFGPEHAQELRALGLHDARYELIDGKDLAWYGPRIPHALERLRQLCAG